MSAELEIDTNVEEDKVVEPSEVTQKTTKKHYNAFDEMSPVLLLTICLREENQEDASRLIVESDFQTNNWMIFQNAPLSSSCLLLAIHIYT